jgi:hypothetical protein
MAERITKENMARALANYAALLAGLDFMPGGEDRDAREARAARITWAAPYGQVMYVMTSKRPTGPGADIHDVPGFMGSGGSGFVTLREGYERVMQSMRTLSDLNMRFPFDHDRAERVRAAVLDAHGVKWSLSNTDTD